MAEVAFASGRLKEHELLLLKLSGKIPDEPNQQEVTHD